MVCSKGNVLYKGIYGYQYMGMNLSVALETSLKTAFVSDLNFHLRLIFTWTAPHFRPIITCHDPSYCLMENKSKMSQ